MLNGSYWINGRMIW